MDVFHDMNKIISFEDYEAKFFEPKLQETLKTFGEKPIKVVTIVSRGEDRCVTNALKQILEKGRNINAKQAAITNAKIIGSMEGNGMWIHNTVAADCNGESWPILIMEARVKYGDKSSDEDWRSILGLSILTSSVLIVNCSEYIPENILMSINYFCRKPVKMRLMKQLKLIFFVENGNSKNDVSNAAVDGSPNLRRTKDKCVIDFQSEDLFEDVKCLLLPKLDVSKGASLAKTPQFQTFCTENVFTLSNIQKCFYGNPLKAKHIMDYCQYFIQALNKNKIVSQNNFHVAQLQEVEKKVLFLEQTALKEELVVKYRNLLKNFIKNNPQIPLAELKEISTTAVADILTLESEAMKNLQIIAVDVTMDFEKEQDAFACTLKENRALELLSTTQNQIYQNYCANCDKISYSENEKVLDDVFKCLKDAATKDFMEQMKNIWSEYPILFQESKRNLETLLHTFSSKKTSALRTAYQKSLILSAEKSIKSILIAFKDNALKIHFYTKTEKKDTCSYENLAQKRFVTENQSFPAIEKYLKILNVKMLDITAEAKEQYFANISKNIENEFSKKFWNLLKDGHFLEDDFLENKETLFWKEALQKHLRPSDVDYDDDSAVVLSSKMEMEVNKHYVSFRTQNKVNREKIIDQTESLQQKCRLLYQDKLRTTYKTARDENTLSYLHNQAKQDAMKSFKDSVGDHSFSAAYCDKLQNDIDTSFEDTLAMCKFKWGQEALETEKATIEVEKYYHREMNKFLDSKRYVNPLKMKEFHQTLTNNAIEKCAQVTLTEFQQNDLKKVLKTAFKLYAERNLMNLPQDPTIGIDLGTTYCCVAIYHLGQPIVLTNKNGQRTTPSYVMFNDNITIVGEAAKGQAYEKPENTIFDTKRMIGRRFDDKTLQKDIKLWPFKVIENDMRPMIEIEGRTYSPEQVSGKLLKEMKNIAEDYLGLSVTKAVITVPAYFDDGQRQATIDAGKIAGLEVLQLISEPIAAALAYKMMNMDSSTKKILTFDLGGGTFDVAVLEMKEGSIDVKSYDGDTHLGGEDFDNKIVDYCIERYKETSGQNLLQYRNSENHHERWNCRRFLSRLRNESERQKTYLSTNSTVNVTLHSVADTESMNIIISREHFEHLNRKLFERSISIVERSLKSAELRNSDIDDVILVGGSTRIPKIQQLLSTYFNGKRLSHQVNPDEAVAVGAAIKAAIINGQILKNSPHYNEVNDVNPFSIGIEVLGGGMSVIIPRNSSIPLSVDHIYETSHDFQNTVAIDVFQGEKIVAIDNMPLGNFSLTGIPRRLKSEEKIIVEMKIDIHGVLHVKATCKSNGVYKTGLVVTEKKWNLKPEELKRILI